MATLLVFVLAVFISINTALIIEKDQCVFSIPSTTHEQMCNFYDLEGPRSMGDVTIKGTNRANEPVTYFLTICGDYPKEKLPTACSSLSAAPAYQYSEINNTCYRLGNSGSPIAVSIDGILQTL